MLEGGADIRYIQALLGHADLSTTEVYTRVSIVQLKAVHERTHPARLRRQLAPPQGAPQAPHSAIETPPGAEQVPAGTEGAATFLAALQREQDDDAGQGVQAGAEHDKPGVAADA